MTHPYFKLAYIERNWGDTDDPLHTRNWKDNAEQLLEQTVSTFNRSSYVLVMMR